MVEVRSENIHFGDARSKENMLKMRNSICLLVDNARLCTVLGGETREQDGAMMLGKHLDELRTESGFSYIIYKFL